MTTTAPLSESVARATIAGLSAADALTWTGWWHRLGSLPPRRNVRLTEAWQHDQALHSSSLPTPYLQASAPSLIDPAGPTDDAEWFAVAVRYHLGQRLDGSPAPEGASVWTELAELREADTEAVRPRVGTVIALENLAAGLQPPASGRENPHYFDDIACVRAIAAGLLRPGRPDDAADLAESDVAFTHALDGVYGARATAALVAVLAGGGEVSEAIESAIASLPAGTWIAHVVAEFMAGVSPGDQALTLAARLEREVVDHVYSYANQAPETLGLLLAHLSVATGGESLLLGALAHPRHADGLVPLAGAVAGAAFGGPAVEGDLPVLRGMSVRPLAGLALEEVLTDLTAAAATAASPAAASEAGAS